MKSLAALGILLSGAGYTTAEPRELPADMFVDLLDAAIENTKPHEAPDASAKGFQMSLANRGFNAFVSALPLCARRC
jgi:hypothetical protein